MDQKHDAHSAKKEWTKNMPRTALKRNGLAELRMRSARQGAKAPFKTKEQNQSTKEGYKYITKTAKSLKKLLTNDIIKSEKKRRCSE